MPVLYPQEACEVAGVGGGEGEWEQGSPSGVPEESSQYVVSPPSVKATWDSHKAPPSTHTKYRPSSRGNNGEAEK